MRVSLSQIRELPAVRRTQPITIGHVQLLQRVQGTQQQQQSTTYPLSPEWEPR